MKLFASVTFVLATAVPFAAQTPGAPAASPSSPLLSNQTLAQIARMRPLFDGKTLHGWIQMPPAPIAFAREDVVDFAAFAKRLSEKSDPVSTWLADQFDDAGKTALAAARTSTDPRETVSPVLRNMNRIVGGDTSLHEPARFANVRLRPETEALRAKNPRGIELARLNRLLVEDAYPRELAQSPHTGWIVKEGAMASTGAGRGVIYTKDDYTHYRLLFQVRQISGNHVADVLIFCQRPPAGERGLDALGAVQFQVPNGGHWDYRPGFNKAGTHFTRPVRTTYSRNEWAQVEMLVDARTGTARMAVAQPVGTRAIENLQFKDPAAGRPGPIAWQMHNAGLFDEFRDVRIEIDPKDDRLITVE